MNVVYGSKQCFFFFNFFFFEYTQYNPYILYHFDTFLTNINPFHLADRSHATPGPDTIPTFTTAPTSPTALTTPTLDNHTTV